MPPLRKVPSEITSLTDQELADQLMEYNYTPGPILPSTRSVYERKLFKLQTGEQASPTVSYEPADYDDDDDGQEADNDSADEEVILQHQQPRMRTTKTSRTEVRKTPPRQPVSSRTSSSNRSQSSQSGKGEISASSKGGLPLWVKFLAIMIVAGLVFLVIKNMEPDLGSEEPDIPDTLEMNV